MSRQQLLLGAGLGILLSSATLALALGYVALFGIQIELLGVRLTPQDFPTDWRAVMVLLGVLGGTGWLSSALILTWRILRRRKRPVASMANPPSWYTGSPSVPYFTPPIPPPEAAYFNLSRHAPHLADTPPQRPTPAELEHTQIPAMPPLLSYESLFPSEQTEQTPPLAPPTDSASNAATNSTPDSAPTLPPPQGA